MEKAMTAKENFTAISGSLRLPAGSLKKSVAADPNQLMEVTLLLRRRPGSAPTIQDVIRGRRTLKRDEFARQYGADPLDITLIRNFAGQCGLTVTHTNIARRSLALQGTVAKFSSAFDVELANYEDSQGRYLRHEKELSVPSELALIVEGVFGFDTCPIARPHLRHSRISQQALTSTPSAAGSGFLTPLQVAERYNFPTEADGEGQCIAIVELGGEATLM
jgi:kumamolisin